MKPDSIVLPTTSRALGDQNASSGICKFGWNWASVKALEAYRLLLVDSAFCNGSLAASEHLSSFIGLADEIVRLEGCIPKSFKVAVDLGTIYSAAAVNNAHDARASNEFIAKANEAWFIASMRLQDDAQRDAALVEPGALRATYLGGYWQIPCEIGYARYLQTNCTDVSHLRALRKHWMEAKQERPNHPILLDIGEHLDKRLSPAQHTEHGQERSSASPASVPPPQRTRRLRIGAVVTVIATLTGLTYLYRPIERASEPQHDAATGALRTFSDLAIPVATEATSAGPGNEPRAIEPSRDTEPETISYAERSAEATPASQEPTEQHQRDGNLPISIAELQQGAATPDTVAETSARNLTSTEASTRRVGSRDVEKAAHFARQGLQALVAGNFTAAQRLFQASENAANGFHYSYEWARLLRTRRAELEAPDRRKEVLRFALSRGYASHAPDDIQEKLRQLAQ